MSPRRRLRPSPESEGRSRAEESLTMLLGGVRGAGDATAPTAAFVVAWLIADRSIGAAALTAVAVSLLIAAWRHVHAQPPRAILVGLLGVSVASAVALYTGRAADFFLVQLAVNAASALAWTVMGGRRSTATSPWASTRSSCS